MSLQAKGLVVTTTQNTKFLVDQLLFDKTSSEIEVFAITKGAQDPHYLSAKPSYTVKLSKADMLISIGFGLEEGWLPLVIRSSRNPRLNDEDGAHLVLGDHLKNPIEIPTTLSRADGDIHPEGNPHFLQSPVRTLELLQVISKRLIRIYPERTSIIEVNLKNLSAQLEKIISKLRESNLSGLKVITYHKTLNYFFHDFGVVVVDYLEPKPGIPPSASHILQLMKKIDSQKIKLVLIENYYADEVSKKLKEKFPDLVVEKIAIEVNGDKETTDIFKLYEKILSVLEKARR